MKTEQLIYLEDISKTHSISQTAQRFFISQQALSFSLTKLEEEFGVKFLERTNRGAELTQAGLLFLEKSRSILQTYHELKEELSFHYPPAYDKNTVPDCTLTIYCHSRILEPLLIDLFEQYTYKYPQVSIRLYENENIEIIDAISNQKGDLGLIFIPDFLTSDDNSYKLPENIQLEQLFSDEFIVCCNTNHPLNKRKSLFMDSFSDTPVILFDTDSTLMTVNDKQIAPASSHQYYSANMAFHKAMIRRGLAISLITSFEFRKLYFKHKDITALPITDSPKSIISLVTNTSAPTSMAAQAFMDLLKKYDFYSL